MMRNKMMRGTSAEGKIKMDAGLEKKRTADARRLELVIEGVKREIDAMRGKPATQRLPKRYWP